MTHSTRTYTLANTEPVTDPAQLQLWWARDTISIRYYPYKVKRVGRSLIEGLGLDILHFQLATQPELGVFKVELTRQYTHVWPDLPSTIQRAKDDGLYGFLMLSEAWETDAQNQISQAPTYNGFQVKTLREGGEKWPIAAKQPAPPAPQQESIGVQRLFERIFTLNR
ncbi:hypothetical protein ACLESO_13605 [Pyxidicoccus sp. 3LG]